MTWVDCVIGDQITLQRGVDITKKTARPGNVPVISSGGVSSFHDTAISDGPGVVIGRKGTLGTVFWTDVPYWPHDTTLWVKDFKGNLPRFVYYFLYTINTSAMDVGAANPTLNRNHVHPLPTRWPDTTTQEAIASTLGSLDDKIEMNRRMNETLEAMARAVFRDWFVDFGPTRRKAAMSGKGGGSDPVAILGGLIPDPAKAAPLAELFPDRFGEDGLPEGWEKSSIYDFAKVIYGAPFKSKLFNSDKKGRPLARIRDLPKHEGGNYTEEVHPKEHLIQRGDIVVGMDGEFRAYVWQGDPTLMNQRVCSFVTHNRAHRAFVWLGIQPQLSAYESSAIGTTVIHLGKGDIDRFRLISASPRLLLKFSELVEPMLDLIVANTQESQTLAATRDLLLPKLMSGEIRLKDVEGMV